MNYDNNNYWGYGNQFSNSYPTPNNYYHYNSTPPPLPHEPYGYNHPSPQYDLNDYFTSPEQTSRREQILLQLDAQNRMLQSMIEPVSIIKPPEQESMQERILSALDNLKQSFEDQNKMLQSMNTSMAETNTSLEQFNNMCGSKQEDFAYNDNSFPEYNHFSSNDLDINGSNERVNIMLDSPPPMDFGHCEPQVESFTSPSLQTNCCSMEYLSYSSSPLYTEAECHYCHICQCLGHEPQHCLGLPYYDDMSESAITLSEEDYPLSEHATSEVNNLKDNSSEFAISPTESLAQIEYIDDDFQRREEEILLCFSQVDTLPESDLDFKASIMEIETLLESPPVMDLDLCQDNIESYSFSSTTPDPYFIESPPLIECCIKDKNVLSWGEVGSYDFIGVDHLLSHDKVWITPFLLKYISPYYVVIALLSVGVAILWGWMYDMPMLMVGAKTSRWEDVLLLNYKRRKKWRVIRSSQCF